LRQGHENDGNHGAKEMTKKTPTQRGRQQRRSKPHSKKETATQQKLQNTLAALQHLKAATPQAAKLIALLESWLKDESGYDEKTWPELKKALDREQDRVGARRLFGA
jgi:hypothetical protein